MMSLEEKKEFLRRLGYNPRLLDPEPHQRKKRSLSQNEENEKKKIDPKEFASVYNIFYPEAKL